MTRRPIQYSGTLPREVRGPSGTWYGVLRTHTEDFAVFWRANDVTIWTELRDNSRVELQDVPTVVAILLGIPGRGTLDPDV